MSANLTAAAKLAAFAGMVALSWVAVALIVAAGWFAVKLSLAVPSWLF